MTDPRAIVLFDGVCNLCNGAVDFVVERDPKGRFAFASLQSEAAHALLREHGCPVFEGDPDSIVLIEDGKVYERSTAALRIARRLASPIKVAWVLVIVPRYVRDFVYAFVAKRRYRWFGKRDACRAPTPELLARFIG